MIYSPLPQSRYRIPIDSDCEFSAIQDRPSGAAVWNLYWLSLPSVDTLPTATRQDWWRNFDQTPGIGFTLIKDVEGDEFLQHELTRHPLRFACWWQHQDHSMYEAFEMLGGGWPATVIARASVAALRLHAASFTASRLNAGHGDLAELAPFRRPR